MAHRVFGVKPADRPPTTFDLEGTLPDGSPWQERFTTVPEAPAGVLDDLMSSVSVDADGRQSWNRVSLMRFMRGVLVEEDVVRFDRLAHDKDRIVSLETLGDVMVWLAEELSGRPSSRPSDSPSGRPLTLTTSRDDSSLPGSTSLNWTSAAT
jgi:hypothetical protein